MRKNFFFALVMMLNFSAFTQIKMNSIGRVGIGGEPVGSYKLTLKENGNCEMDFVNGNGHEFILGNYTSSLWGAPNAFSLWDKTREKSLLEFREEEAFIHDRLVIGHGYSGNKPTLELNDEKFMMFSLNTTSSIASGILFRELLGYNNNSVEYGAKIQYEADRDVLTLGTYQGWGYKEAISIYRPYGNVGIGGRYLYSTYKLYVNGRAYCTGGSWEASDERFKEDIKEVSTEAAKLKKLRGVSYKKKDIDSMLDSMSINSEGNAIDYVSVDSVVLDKMDSIKHKKAIVPERSYGFIAQEVREIYPDLVLEDESGYLAVNYTGFIPIIVESFKEQQEVIDSLKKENVYKQTKLNNLSSEIELLKKQMALLESKLTECCVGVSESKQKSAGLTDANNLNEGND